MDCTDDSICRRFHDSPSIQTDGFRWPAIYQGIQFDLLPETYYWVKAEIAVNQQVITHLASFVPLYDKLHDIRVDARRSNII